MEPITISRRNLSIKITASPTPFISESGNAFFSIGVYYTHPYICNGRVRIMHHDGPRETITFHFNRFLDRSQLQTVADKLSSLTNVRDPIFFEEYFLDSITDFCNRATSIYHGCGVEFLTYVELPGAAAPPVQEASYIDEVLVFDFDVQGSGNRRSSSNRAIEKLERIKDVSLIRLSSGQCVICLEEFGRGNDSELGKTPCLHVFHYRCVKRWLERKRTCPLCRSDICG